jgi:hypothetical protein
MGADGTVTAFTLFATKAAAEESNQKLPPWIRENLGFECRCRRQSVSSGEAGVSP